MSPGRRLFWAYGALSLAAVGAGCAVAAAQGVPAGVWVRDPAAWALGLGAALLLTRLSGPTARAAFLLAVPLGLALTLVSAGLQGVHRWTHLGPLQINMAEVLLPIAVVALAALTAGRRWPWLIAAVILALLITQPDASQATAFGGAMIVIARLAAAPRSIRWGVTALASLAIAVAWLRPDPLAPVPEVEHILQLAWALSPAAAIAAGALLATSALAPWFALSRGGQAAGAAAAGLTVYLLLSAAMPAVGAFPVPLVGLATSPILGFWLGVGLLAAQAAQRNAAAPTP